MGAAVLGSYTRVRWAPCDPMRLSPLDSKILTRVDVEPFLDGGSVVWGLPPGQLVELRGQEVRRRLISDDKRRALEAIEAAIAAGYDAAIASWPDQSENDEREWVFPDFSDFLDGLTADEFALRQEYEGWDKRVEYEIQLPHDPQGCLEALPAQGCWLVAVEHGEHPWAALRGTTPMTAADVTLDWLELTVPGTPNLTLGRPRRGCRPFELIWPDSKELPRPAQLDLLTGRPLTGPFLPEKGPTDLRWSPVYRYGILTEGLMRWIDVLSGAPPEPLRPSTLLLRARLALLRRELEARGVNYEDDEDGHLYELAHAISDSMVPTDFHEPSAPIIRSVSSYYDHENKVERAQVIYDPELDLNPLGRQLGYRVLPSEVEVREVSFIDYPDEVNGRQVTREWLDDVTKRSAAAAGLSGDLGGARLTAQDEGRLRDSAPDVPPIQWNAVDAADRIQNYVYLFAEDGSAMEAQLSTARDAIVSSVLAAAGHAQLPLGRQPGPFPLRCVAVMRLADAQGIRSNRRTLQRQAATALDGAEERRLASFWAARLGADPAGIASIEGGDQFDIDEVNSWFSEQISP